MGDAAVEPLALMSDFLRQCGGYAVIDGGLATELQRHGEDLKDPLWSAKCLSSSPQLIRKVHLDYMEAGANIVISASYQATLQGFEAKGLSREEGEALLRKSVEIAREAREIFHSRGAKVRCDVKGSGEILKQGPVLVAASVGSYGAYLADGSEYSGTYGDAITLEILKDFHRRRVQVLAESGADLIAFETIPNKLEAKAYAELLEEEDIKVVAVGINCTPPRFIHGLIQEIRKVTTKPIVVYPNVGETYDAEQKEWAQTSGVTEDFVSYVGMWAEAGASLIGSLQQIYQSYI